MATIRKQLKINIFPKKLLTEEHFAVTVGGSACPGRKFVNFRDFFLPSKAIYIGHCLSLSMSSVHKKTSIRLWIFFEGEKW